MSKNKTRAAAAAIPQSREEAAYALAQYGAAMRELEKLETEMNEEIAKVKHGFVKRAAPHRITADALASGLQSFCEANKKALIDAAGAKTVNLGTGKVAWRWNPAKAVVRGKEADTIEAIKLGGAAMAGFIRTTFEINKVGMLRDPALARTLDGVEIVDGVETFEVKPDSVKIPEAKIAEAAE